MEQNDETNHSYYFALMLSNSANHLPTIIDNLLRVIYQVGEQNVFLSIYEAGSTDEGHTTAMIETIKTTLEAIGVEYSIRIEGDVPPDALNAVLAPLKEMYRSEQRVFNTVVMMGDDLWCCEEFLELLFQSRGQAASVTCSTDVRQRVYYYVYLPDFRATCFPSRQATMSMADSFMKGISAHTSRTSSRPLDSKRITRSGYSLVSLLLRFLTRPLFILHTTFLFLIPATHVPVTNCRLGKINVDSPRNSIWQ